MVCPEEKVFFLHIPKCGGSAIEGFLMKHYNYGLHAGNTLVNHFYKYNIVRGWTICNLVHLPYSLQDKVCRDGKIYMDNSWLKFTIVRNPYHRITSELLWQEVLPIARNYEKLRTHKEVQYLFNVDQNKFFTKDPANNQWFNHRVPQSWLLDFDEKEDNFLIYKYEDGLTNIIKKHFEVSSDFELKRVNDPHQHKKISRPDYSSFWTKDFIENCNKWYKEDFERFGYEMLDPNDYPEF